MQEDRRQRTIEELHLKLWDEQTNPLKRGAERVTRYSQVSARLWELYGPGERPRLRRTFFGAVERLCVQHGEPVYLLVKALVTLASDKDSPDRYFISAFKQRAIDEGWEISPE